MSSKPLDLRQSLKAGGASAFAASARPSTVAAIDSSTRSPLLRDGHRYPKLTMITRYSPERLKFAASAGYECVELIRNGSFTPEKLSDSQIEKIKTRRSLSLALTGMPELNRRAVSKG